MMVTRAPERPAPVLPPRARRTIFVGFRVAALAMWGPAGLAEIGARMSPEARRASVEPVTIEDDMLPEQYVLEWYQAVWEGPAQRNKDVYNQFLQRMMDHGFGRVRKLLLQAASASLLASKASELWRHDHTNGQMVYERGDERSAVVTLAEHVYLSTPIGRASVCEIMRYALALTRSRNVRASYVYEESARIRVSFTWD